MSPSQTGNPRRTGFLPSTCPTLTRTGEGLRVTLAAQPRSVQGVLREVIHLELPGWNRGDWADVLIRARAYSANSVNLVGLGFNLREERGNGTDPQPPFQFFGQSTPVVRDGTIQTYRLRVGQGSPDFTGPWRHLLLYFGSEGEPASIEILSVSVVPRGHEYAEAPHGVRPVDMGDRLRQALFTHAPARISYRVRVPEGARFDASLGIHGRDDSVTFRVGVQAGGDEETVFEELYADGERWAPRSVDLAQYAGQTVTLTLDAEAEQPGTVAFWGAPTVSGARMSDKPNVIF